MSSWNVSGLGFWPGMRLLAVILQFPVTGSQFSVEMLCGNLLQHTRGHQLLLDVPLQNLHQKLAQIASLLLGPGLPAKLSTGARNIWAASARDSPEISDDASRLSSAHSKPSASA